MFAVNKILKRLTLTIASVMLVGIVLLSTAATPVQASPLTDLGNIQIVAVAPKGTIQPKTDATVGFDELESGKEAAKLIPKDLGNSNKDIKGRIERAAGELGNDQYQRVFGGITEDTKLSEAERKVEQKANR